MMWSNRSRRQLSTQRSATPLCQGLSNEVRTGLIFKDRTTAGTSIPYLPSRSKMRNRGADSNGNASRNCWISIVAQWVLRLSSPDEGPLDPRGSPGWLGAGIDCPTCGHSNFYRRPGSIVFETLEPRRQPDSRLQITHYRFEIGDFRANTPCFSGQQLLDYVPLDVGEAEIASLKTVGQFRVIESQ